MDISKITIDNTNPYVLMNAEKLRDNDYACMCILAHRLREELWNLGWRPDPYVEPLINDKYEVKEKEPGECMRVQMKIKRK